MGAKDTLYSKLKEEESESKIEVEVDFQQKESDCVSKYEIIWNKKVANLRQIIKTRQS